MTTEQELKTRDFDAWCEPEFYKVLENEINRLERGAMPLTDTQIGNALGCTKDEVYNFRRRHNVPNRMGRMANCCSNIMRHFYCMEHDMRYLKADLSQLKIGYEARGDLLKRAKKDKASTRGGLFFLGFIFGFLFVFLAILIFGTPVA